MNSEPVNAIAGPSNSRNHAQEAASSSDLSMSETSPSFSTHSTRLPSTHSVPPLYLPPPGPPPPQTLLASTQDLISRFDLLPLYDKYVRSSIVPADGSSPSGPSVPGHSVQGPMAPVTGAGLSGPGALDKGKGKEVVMDGQTGVGMPMPGSPRVAVGVDDDDAKAEKKKKNSYKHLIKGIPGKHSMKKDDFLSTTMLIPPKQRIPILPFDARTQRDAFAISLEGLKGWNIYTLVEESPQAKEDRKKRKELRRLAKAQAAAFAAQKAGSISQDQSFHTPAPTTAQSKTQAASPTSAGATTPRPTPTVPRPGTTGMPTATPTPVKVQAHSPTLISRADPALPRPKSTVPRPGSTKQPVTAAPMPTTRPGLNASVGTPLRSGTPMQVDQQRGKKREREEGMINGVIVGHGPPATTITNAPSIAMAEAKAGIASVRPRPLKKQKMDMQGQARDVSAPVQQQPTPQGV